MHQDIVKIHIVGKANEQHAEMQLWLKDVGKWVQIYEASRPPYNIRVIQVLYQERFGWLALIERPD